MIKFAIFLKQILLVFAREPIWANRYKDLMALLMFVHAQFSSIQSLSHVWLCDPMNCSTPGLPVHPQLPEFTQTHVHRICDAIQPSHPLSSPFPPAPNPSRLFMSPWTVAHQLLCPWDSPGKNTGVVCHFLLQGIFPTQGSNLHLLHWQEDSLLLSHLGSWLYW